MTTEHISSVFAKLIERETGIPNDRFYMRVSFLSAYCTNLDRPALSMLRPISYQYQVHSRSSVQKQSSTTFCFDESSYDMSLPDLKIRLQFIDPNPADTGYQGSTVKMLYFS